MRSVFLLLLLTACVPQPVLTNAVPVFAHYTEEEQRDMGEAFDALPKKSPLRPLIRDCKALRDQVRASAP